MQCRYGYMHFVRRGEPAIERYEVPASFQEQANTLSMVTQDALDRYVKPYYSILSR